MGEVFFVMMVPITAIVTTGAVLIIRPISTKLGGLIEVMTQERKQRSVPAADMARVRDLLGAIDNRLSLLEERQDFAEALISTGDRRVLPAQRMNGNAEHN